MTPEQHISTSTATVTATEPVNRKESSEPKFTPLHRENIPGVASSLPEQDSSSGISSETPGVESDFYWTYQEEPHRSRRRAIIAAHPEVTKLCGPEPLTKWVVLGVLATQFTVAYLLTKFDVSFFSFTFWAAGYVIGATSSQNLFLAIHELAHGLGFKKRLHNQLFAVVANLPIAVPYAAGFGPYHLLHHKYLGDSQYDTDLPTALEAFVLSSVAGKAFFATFQIFFYAIRPMCVMTLPFSFIHYINLAVVILFDLLVVSTLGWKPIVYFLLSDFLAGSLHPLAGHFIAEHYVLDPDAPNPEQPGNMKNIEVPSSAASITPKMSTSSNPSLISPPETYSYYGPLNLFIYNAGYHNEHHDFPYVAWTKLPKVNEIAKEFYDPLPSHQSWTKVIFDFVLDRRVSLYSRVKRAKETVDSDDYEHPEKDLDASPAAKLAGKAQT